MQPPCDTCAQQRISTPTPADHPGPGQACAECGAEPGGVPVVLLMDRRSRVFVRRRVEWRHAA